MHDEQVSTKSDSSSKFTLIVLCVALIVAVIGLASMATQKQPNANVITGDLEVSYMLITSKSPTLEEASGSTIGASRVEYLPNYVLVTTKSDVTLFWPIDRLKKLEVARLDRAKVAREHNDSHH